MTRPRIPAAGAEQGALLDRLTSLSATDVDYRGGRTWSLVYWVDEAHHHVCEQAHNLFMDANALNPMAFKSLKRLEHEVVQMTAAMLNGPDTAVGTMTTGGTESLLLAVKTCRDRARAKKPWILRPNIVVPASIHVAVDKACHYFGVRKKVAPVLDDGRVDVEAMAALIDSQTIMLAASAPQYPWGSIDPIPEIGALAEARGLPFHVDACFGGFMLPWLERLGVAMPAWDFRVPGVTSISADLHKYGYAPKGASVIVYRDMSHLRHQFFVTAAWTGGIYISPSIPGTRSGGNIASAWASLMSLGEEGFLRLARGALETAQALRAGIADIPGLKLLGRPDATIVTWASDDPAVDVYAVADLMQARGWPMDRQQKPASIHLSANAVNAPVVPQYLADLREAVAEVRANPGLRKEGEAAVYGLMAKIPLKGLVEREVLKVMEQMYAADGEERPLSESRDGGAVQRFAERYGDEVFGAIARVQGLGASLRKRARGFFKRR
jgi:sphinganine-1-phosphate aldolase